MIKMKNNSNPIDVNTYFKEVFTNAGIGIMTLDAKSSIEYINEEALNIFGYKYSALVNTNFSTHIHSTDQEYLKQYFTGGISLFRYYQNIFIKLNYYENF